MRFLLKNILILLLSCFFALALHASDVVLLVTTDIHGNIVSGAGGLLKLSSAIKDQETKEGKEKILLIDCGDTLQGSFAAALSKGELPLKIINLLGYDFWIPGNHDFDYGFDIFLKRASAFKGTVLASNLESKEAGSQSYTAYSIIKKNGLKIAIVGATFPGINNSEALNGDAPFSTTPLSSALQNVMPKILRADPDVIVLAVHGGLYNKNWVMTKEIKRFPQIDIVLGGHTHEPIAGKKLYNSAYFLQAGHGGEFLGKIDITKNKENGKMEIKSELIKIYNYPVDIKLENQINPELAQVNSEGNKKIAYLEQAQEGGLLIAKSMKKYTQNDIAIFGLSQQTSKLSGIVTIKDTYGFVPHEDYVSTMSVTKDELKLIIEDIYKRKKGKYKKVYWTGFGFEISKKAKVLGITLPDSLEKKERITLAIPSYYIEYPTVKFPEIKRIAEKKEAEYKNSDKTVREVFVKYLLEKFPPKNQP